MESSSNTSADGVVVKAPTEHPSIRINKWRVREGFPVTVSQVILFYEALGEDGKSVDKVVHKLRATSVGVVKNRLCKEGAVVKSGAAILELSDCVHTTVIKDMCADCGADLRQNENGKTSEASVPMVHSIPDLKVTQKLAQKLGHDDTRRLLQSRKLVLLVDLDQTVIHTTNDNVPNNIKGIYHFQLYGPHSPWYHTRLRPGTHEFLKNMSKYYELHICTFGARNYAHMIAQLLDPKGDYFSQRILSRDECFNSTSKTDNLRALFPNGDSMVCIIDDREDVWNMASNLIQVKPYHFFQHTGDINAPPGLSKHELDGEGVDFKNLKKLANEKESTDDSEATEETEKSTGTEETPSEAKNEESVEHEMKKAAQTKEEESNEHEMTEAESAEKEESKKHEIKEAGTTLPEATTIPAAASEHTEATDVVSVAAEKELNGSLEEQEAINKVDNDSLEAQEGINKEDNGTAKEEQPELDDLPSTSVKLPQNIKPTDGQHEIEIEDPDDYLLHLEVILKNIHERFFQIYKETQEIPDLKIIVPKIRSEVLVGQNLVFSGLVPTNMKLEQSRAYFIAKSLGANVSQVIGPDTTHLVAVTSGTFKVNAAKKVARIKVVNADWLWSCAERWEHVDERLFQLDKKVKSKKRQPPAHCHSPKHFVNYSEKTEFPAFSNFNQQNEEPEKFMDTINPLLIFSNEDLANMAEDVGESDSSSDDEHINIENPPVDKSLRKRKRREEEDEKRSQNFFTRPEKPELQMTTDDISKSSDEDIEDNEEDDDEGPSAKFRRGECPSDLENDSDSYGSENNQDDGDDSEWNMMGAALEREFLGLED